MRLCRIVPNVDCLVKRAGRDELLAHAYVQSRDLSPVKGPEHVVELGLIIVRVLVVRQIDL